MSFNEAIHDDAHQGTIICMPDHSPEMALNPPNICHLLSALQSACTVSNTTTIRWLRLRHGRFCFRTRGLSHNGNVVLNRTHHHRFHTKCCIVQLYTFLPPMHCTYPVHIKVLLSTQNCRFKQCVPRSVFTFISRPSIRHKTTTSGNCCWGPPTNRSTRCG